MMIKTRLRQERERRGWSRNYIAERLEVDVVTVGRWERGERLPHPYYRQKLCILFAMTAEELCLLPENILKSDKAANPPNISEKSTVTSGLSVTESENSQREPVQQASSMRSKAAMLLPRQRCTVLLGLGALGIASLAGISVLYAMRLREA